MESTRLGSRRWGGFCLREPRSRRIKAQCNQCAVGAAITQHLPGLRLRAKRRRQKTALAVADHKIPVAERTLNPFARSRRRAAGSCRPKHTFASRNCGGRGGSKACLRNRELQAKPCGLHDARIKASALTGRAKTSLLRRLRYQPGKTAHTLRIRRRCPRTSSSVGTRIGAVHRRRRAVAIVDL